MAKEHVYQLAIDAGGTMSDAFLCDEEGRFILGKALTNPDDESSSYAESVEDAAGNWDLSSAEAHKNSSVDTYTGTSMLNILLTASGAKVGLICSKALAALPHLERGLTWLHLSYEDQIHQALQEHSEPLVEMNRIKPVAEIVKGNTYYPDSHIAPGSIICPLNEDQVARAAEELLDDGVEIIGILFMNSHVNPAHEVRARQIVENVMQRRNHEVRVVVSSELCPLAMESQRMKSLLLECYCTPGVQKQLTRIEDKARSLGFDRDLQTLLSYGATANIRHPRLYEAIVSGPTGGLLGCKALFTDLVGEKNVLCSDLGGTSFDVGLIIDGLLPIVDEPVFHSHKINLPMLKIDSIGAGTGSVVHVDDKLHRIDLRPESAGSKIGTCYTYPDITIADIDVVLGYLNPDNFLGGKISLDRKKAVEALTERLAKPLGEDLYEICSKTLDLIHTKMCELIKVMMLSRGLDTTNFTLASYGGGGPLHLWGIADRVDFKKIVTCPWAAAFSAFGVAAADYSHRYEAGALCLWSPETTDAFKLGEAQSLNEKWKALEEKALAELGSEGFAREDISFTYGVRARYIGQWSSWDVPGVRGRIESMRDLHDVVASFERVYTSSYPAAARFSEAGYAITGLYLIATCTKPKPAVVEYEMKSHTPSKSAFKGQREVFHGGGWQQFEIWEMDLLEPGNRVDGPAILEHPMTTLVVPPSSHVHMDERKLIWYQKD
jgi:N-methylhydantoinase A